MKKGFYIKKLIVEGLNKKTSILEFKKGFNLISGVSDTGKSYAFSCIDYLLGRSDVPKDIPEARGYDDYYLEIKTYNNDPHTIYRSITNDEVIVKNCIYGDFKQTESKTTLKLKHSASNDNNLSVFLLKISGLHGKEFKKSKVKKKTVSFRDIRNLTIIHESKIITEKSPLYPTGQYADQTFYKSLFNYILDGNDFSDFIEVEPQKDKKIHILGQLEFIIKEREKLNNEISILSAKLELVDNTANHSSTFEEYKNKIADNLLKLTYLNEQIKINQDDILLLNNKKNMKEELISRFKLLVEHYQNDIDRLSFIVEGNELLNQLNTVPCPICENSMLNSVFDEIQHEDLKEAMLIEYENNKKKIIDIEKSILNLQNELTDIDLIISENKLNKISYDNEREVLISQITPIQNKLKELEENQLNVNRINIFTERIEYLFDEERLLNETLDEKTTTDNTSDNSALNKISDFCNKLISIMKDIGYPGWKSITFNDNYKTFDFIISGKPRKSFGKGYRSISYSAVILTIIDWVIENEINFNPLAILDSPLTTYHGKNALRENDDEAEADIQDKFFSFLSKTDNNRQIIVFDNKIPKKEIIEKINFIYFSGNTNGERVGFIEEAI